ncbi:hypothetical protein V2G26_000766 [Clonostachys chloroleuca]|uniref:Uncharacterized protein n=1 Tax=Clonostachys chloroleuca TaxID=1926264 RepID=A0AA35VPK8_9HYPO|nr:unnamed protein product [Clonostachys chloroleuca]
MSAEVSHGRGGAGNFNADDTKYEDGSIVRVGDEGSHGDGAYSAGRGGAGNIGDAGVKGAERKDADVIPEAAVRNSININHHTGRGGAGNEQHAASEETAASAEKAATAGTPASPRGLADKLKNKIFGAFKK